MRATLLGLLIAVWLAGTCLGQPTIPKDQIPVDAPAVVRAEIEKRYSASGDERGWACTRIEQMGEKAAPAIPFLAALLGDTALHREWIDPQGPYMDHPVGSLAAAALARIGKPAAETLLAALRSPDEKVRHGAVVGLYRMRQPPVDAVADAHRRATRIGRWLWSLRMTRRRIASG
jgi:hypothetical protein